MSAKLRTRGFSWFLDMKKYNCLQVLPSYQSVSLFIIPYASLFLNYMMLHSPLFRFPHFLAVIVSMVLSITFYSQQVFLCRLGIGGTRLMFQKDRLILLPAYRHFPRLECLAYLLRPKEKQSRAGPMYPRESNNPKQAILLVCMGMRIYNNSLFEFKNLFFHYHYYHYYYYYYCDVRSVFQ
ncbi:uncharacterized protein LOC120016891 [Tripterygium wilfordii]|uniref:uncharacterized protein LOC120016891 n=1 Tax=Tripterygium wilfordii TaxID=458696 RepID=UPI0018F7EF85|nr:uncharacterized protein LOC120016891 [Tripterygium wilfordii]